MAQLAMFRDATCIKDSQDWLAEQGDSIVVNAASHTTNRNGGVSTIMIIFSPAASPRVDLVDRDSQPVREV